MHQMFCWNIVKNLKEEDKKRGREMGRGRGRKKKRGGILVWKMGSPRRFGRNTVAWLQPCFRKAQAGGSEDGVERKTLGPHAVSSGPGEMRHVLTYRSQEIERISREMEAHQG